MRLGGWARNGSRVSEPKVREPSPPEPVVAALDPERVLAACDLEFVRAGGPGGQHRNRRETGVRLTHRPTGIVVMATERRSQVANRRLALERLLERLEARRKKRKPRRTTVKSRAVRARERDAKSRERLRKSARRERPSED